MEFLEVILHFLQEYPISMAWLSGFLAEEILLFLIFLAGQEFIPFWTTIFAGLFGVYCIDSIYYLIGKHKKFENFVKYKLKKSRFSNIIKYFDKITNHNKTFTLFLSKFIYGPRMVIVMYFAANGMTYREFMKREIIALILWSMLMVPLAWLAGIGIISSFSLVKKIEKIFIGAIIFVIIFYLIGLYLINRFIKKI